MLRHSERSEESKGGMKIFYVYILTNRPGGTLYVGVTNNLTKRVIHHKQGLGSKFTQKYRLHKLIYFEEYASIKEAITREKVLKGWKRCRKIEIIEKQNPNWNDLFLDYLNC